MIGGIDQQLAHLASGHALLVVLAIALALGLRHATDPDHLAAVSTLIAGDPADGARRAGRLGLAWGLGHATTLVAFGLPIVLFKGYLPGAVQQAAEVAVGLVIMALALRVIVRWRRGQFHAHVHRHGSIEHRHLHPHADVADHGHGHHPEKQLGRSPAQAYGVGLIHGTGGSGGVGVLLLAGLPSRGEAAAALVVFAFAAALSMATLSSGFGYALTRGPILRRMLALAPATAALSLAFGAWYALGAVNAAPYPL